MKITFQWIINHVLYEANSQRTRSTNFTIALGHLLVCSLMCSPSSFARLLVTLLAMELVRNGGIIMMCFLFPHLSSFSFYLSSYFSFPFLCLILFLFLYPFVFFYLHFFIFFFSYFSNYISFSICISFSIPVCIFLFPFLCLRLTIRHLFHLDSNHLNSNSSFVSGSFGGTDHL